MLERIVCLLIGYACGLIQTSYLYGKKNHIDIREHGSGNAGTTNALRTLGKKAGIITFLGDFLKPMLAALLAWLLYRNKEAVLLLELYAGIGAVFGHIFPCYLGFRGGKGVATMGGISALFCIQGGCWYLIPIMLVLFVIVVAVSRYVSLGSLLMVWTFFVGIVVSGQCGRINLDKNNLYEAYVLTGIYAVITVIKHRTNIRRLIRGEENKIFQKKEN